MKYGIYIILFIIVILMSIFYFEVAESFQTSNTTKVLTSQRMNLENTFVGESIVLPYTGWDYVIDQLITKQPMDVFQNPDMLILDSKDLAAYAKDYSVITTTPKGYFCVFTSASRKDDFVCGYDWTDKRIGFFDRIEKNIIDSVIFGYRTTAKPSWVSIQRLDNIPMLFTDIDVLIVYVVPDSPMAKLLADKELYLLDWNTIDLSRLKISYPVLNRENVSLTQLFGVERKIKGTSDTVANLLYTELSMIRLTTPANDEVETFITRLELTPQDDTYKCFGDDTIHSKLLCESKYDIMGELKSTKNVWDKPCTKNEECPYFQANKNYPNDRGGCQKEGYCEMPVGILNTSFMKAYEEDPYQPFCYQCSDPTNKECCKEQAKMIQMNTSELKSPDYAFIDDAEERKKYNLPYTILI